MIPSYAKNAEIYDNYRALAKFIKLDGILYEFESSERKSDTEIHHYRCEDEQYNLQIHLQDGYPFYVDGFYKIGGYINAVHGNA